MPDNAARSRLGRLIANLNSEKCAKNVRSNEAKTLSTQKQIVDKFPSVGISTNYMASVILKITMLTHL